MVVGSKMILAFIKLVFLATVSFGRPLAIENVKIVSLNDEPSLARLMLIYLNLDKFSYHPFVVSSEGCNEVAVLLMTYLQWSLTYPIEYVSTKVINMIPGINESKSLVIHI